MKPNRWGGYDRAPGEDRCRCGCTAADREHSAACYIKGCPFPRLAR